MLNDVIEDCLTENLENVTGQSAITPPPENDYLTDDLGNRLTDDEGNLLILV